MIRSHIQATKDTRDHFLWYILHSLQTFITKTLKKQAHPDRSHHFISLSLLGMNFIQNEYFQDYV